MQRALNLALADRNVGDGIDDLFVEEALIQFNGLGVYSANHDARAADRINAKKPAKLLDSISLTLRI